MKDKKTGKSIAINRKMSPLDIEKLNIMYPCKSKKSSCGKFMRLLYYTWFLYSSIFTSCLEIVDFQFLGSFTFNYGRILNVGPNLYVFLSLLELALIFCAENVDFWQINIPKNLFETWHIFMNLVEPKMCHFLVSHCTIKLKGYLDFYWLCPFRSSFH